MEQSNYREEQIQNIKATPQEMDAWEALRREPGLTGRLARRGKHMKRDYVGGRRSFKAKGGSEDGRIDDTHRIVAVTDIEASALNYLKNQDKKQGHPTGSGPRLRAMAAKDDQPLEYMMYKGMKIPSLNDFGMDEGSEETGGREDRGGFTSSGGDFGSNDYGNDPTPTPTPSGGNNTPPPPPPKTPEQIEAERKAAAKKKYDADKKTATEKYEKDKAGRDRSKYTEGTMRDAEGRTMEDRGVMTDAEGRVEGDEGFDFETAEMKGGYDESTGKMDTEGSFAGYQEDYKGLRDRADYSATREGVLTDASGKREGEAGYDASSATMQGGLEQYQRQADKLAGEAKGKYAGYESDIAGQPDYASKVATMAGGQAKTGTDAQTALANLSSQIDTSTTAGKKALSDAAGKMGIASGDIKEYESKVGEFAQAGQDAGGRGEAAGKAGATAITGAAGQGMTQAQQAQQAMGTASDKLGGMADKAMDTGALMKDRGLFAGQIEAKRKAAEKGKLGNLRRSMAASGASPAEIARAEAEASGGGQAGREDALAASMASMQSGQSQLGQAAGMTGQQAQIAAQGGSLGLQGAGMGLQGAQAAGQMNMAGAGMGMQGAQMGMQGAGQMAGMAGQRAALAGQQGAMGLQGAQLGLAGAGQKAGNISAGAGAAMQGQQGAMQGYQAAQNLGIGKTQAAAGMYGAGVGTQQGLMNMGSSLANQQQMSLQNEITQQQGLTGSMAGMTEAQLQDVVAQQNAAQQKDLAERGLLVQQQANQANAPRSPSQAQQLMNLVQTGAQAYGTYKAFAACIPEGIKIDTLGGGIAIEDIKVGTMVKGYYGPETEVLQVHQYKEDPAPHRFYHITFDNGGAVDCCDMHRIAGKRAKDYKVGDVASANRITSITRYNGVRRSYDLLTADGGYRMGNTQINSMISEVAQGEVAEMNKIKLAA